MCIYVIELANDTEQWRLAYACAIFLCKNIIELLLDY